MTFQFDTSGVVGCRIPRADGKHWRTWSCLSPFVQGYVEGLFRELCGTPEPMRGACHDPEPSKIPYDGAGFSDLARETLARIMEDCDKAPTGFFLIEDRGGRLSGARFWRERSLGDWDIFPPLTPYLGDDGRVYLRE